MNHTTRSAQAPSLRTGIFAVLSDSLRAKGTGAPSLRLLAVAVVVATAFLALSATSASAKQARIFTGTFGAAANPAPFPANPYPLGNAGSVAVDSSSGDIYAAEARNSRVEKFDPAGNFLLMFGKAVNQTAVEAARPEAEQNVCPAPGHPADVCQAGQPLQPESEQSPLESPTLIAVDNSAGPSHGDVYLANERQTEGTVQKFDSSGELIESWATGGSLDGSAVTNPPASVAGPFTRVIGIAVDPSGNLWVSTEAAITESGFVPPQNFKFGQNSEFAEGVEFHQPGNEGGHGVAGQLTIDSADNFYFRSGSSALKFSATGKAIGQVAPTKAELEQTGGGAGAGNFVVNGLAVDTATGDLYLDGPEGVPHFGIIKRYDSSCQPVLAEIGLQPGCEPVEAFGSNFLSDFPQGIAIDSGSATKPLYVADGEHLVAFRLLTVPDVTTTKPTAVTGASATLTGTINPAGIELNSGLEGCRFEWGESAAYGHTAPCDKSAAQIGAGNAPVAVSASITGLEAGKTYHYRLLASNPNDENANVHQPEAGADLAFGPPLYERASPISVAATAADIRIEVNPNDLDTHARIEYGTAAGVYPNSTAAVDLGSAGVSQSADFELSGLQPGTAYHYRVIAENILGEGPEATTGPDLIFTTQAASPFGPPDSRQWQLVSPARKLGAAIRPIQQVGLVQAAANGDAIAYLAFTPSSLEPTGYPGEEQILSRRDPAGWSSRDITIPHASATGTVLQGREYRSFDSNLTLGAVQPQGPFNPALSAEASESTAFLHGLGDSCADRCFRPLVSGAAGFANVPPGTEFGTGVAGRQCEPGPSGEGIGNCGPEFRAATDDLAHIVLDSNVALTADPEDHGGLYQWSAGTLHKVDVPPAGGTAKGALDQAARHAISADGSRVIWGIQSPQTLYLRANATAPPSLSGACDEAGKACTIQLDTAEPTCLTAGECESGGGTFQAASADGSRVYFTDTHKLTADSGAQSGGGFDKADLYECAIVESTPGEPSCQLTDLTPEAAGEKAAEVQGGIVGASDDGSYLYFVAKGVLAANSVDNGGGPEAAQPGQPNLYLLHEGTTTFIAGLAGEDPDYSRIGTQATRVSPNGRFLALMSQRSLTGYDNRDLATGRPVQEVFLYRAEPGGQGSVICASCGPTGARPRGTTFKGGESPAVKGGLELVNSLVAASVPSWQSGLGPLLSTYQPRYLSDSGRLFFNTLNPLVPADSNGTQDVYQFEPPGVGSCTTSSPTFGQSSGGCVGLISAGTSGEESAFLDASETGDDVFFFTSSRLVPQDEDAAPDVYDAHVCSAQSPCLSEPPPPAPACEGDACQQPAQPPVDQTPGSLTFNGAGNVLQCPKGKVKRSGKCVAKKSSKKKHHKKKVHKKQKRANSKHGGQK